MPWVQQHAAAEPRAGYIGFLRTGKKTRKLCIAHAGQCISAGCNAKFCATWLELITISIVTIRSIWQKFCGSLYSKFVNLVAPPDDKNGQYPVRMKGQFLPKKMLKSASKWTHKPWHNTCSEYVPSNEHRAGKHAACTKDKQTKNKHTNTIFSHLQPARVVWSSPNFARWYRTSRPFSKGDNDFSIQRIVFPTGCTEKFRVNNGRAVSRQ